jgi:hypothetical protein
MYTHLVSKMTETDSDSAKQRVWILSLFVRNFCYTTVKACFISFFPANNQSMRNNVHHILGQIQPVHKRLLEGKLNKKFMVHILKLYFTILFVVMMYLCIHPLQQFQLYRRVFTIKKYRVAIKRLMSAIYVIIITINKAMLQLKGERQIVVLLLAAFSVQLDLNSDEKLSNYNFIVNCTHASKPWDATWRTLIFKTSKEILISFE